jgi:hypothetical protein
MRSGETTGRFMKRMAYALAMAVLLSGSTLRAAESVKTYQVTGPILELTDKKIVVQKGDEKWELERDANTKVQGALKVGAKVTIEYRMTATKVETKSATATEKKR